eukprot:1571859-Alexandrium_andersonii.AAC.1
MATTLVIMVVPTAMTMVMAMAMTTMMVPVMPLLLLLVMVLTPLRALMRVVEQVSNAQWACGCSRSVALMLMNASGM